MGICRQQENINQTASNFLEQGSPWDDPLLITRHLVRKLESE